MLLTQILVIVIICLAVAGLAWWMRKETGSGSSCGSSCSCCTKCDEFMKARPEEKTSETEKKA